MKKLRKLFLTLISLAVILVLAIQIFVNNETSISLPLIENYKSDRPTSLNCKFIDKNENYSCLEFKNELYVPFKMISNKFDVSKNSIQIM